jgi:DUF4097 and DUF4098 domain-containing protein YvlB
MSLANGSKEHPRHRPAAAVALAAALLLAAGAALAGTPIDERTDAASDGTIIVENINGSVVVTGWDKNEVHLTGSLSEDADELIFERDGDTVTIEVKFPRRIRGNVEESDFDIKVPEGSSLEIETVSADIDVEGVRGEHDLESVSGNVTVEGDAKRLDAESVSGFVEVTGRIPEVSAESVSGRITLEGTEGEADASTTSGGIEIVGGNFRRVSCESVSGKIRFEGTPAEDGEFHFECLSGSVTLVLPSDLSAEVEVESFSGSIDSDFGGKVHHPKYGPGASFDAVYGDGDADITVETFSGSVKIREK